ncbi:MAG: ribosome-binding factor A [Nitrospinae bacterium]|nr:ribosome-binding factor A [Nitrospinota bacterium]
MPREFSRGRRIADLIQRELAILIQREMKDPRLGMVTINDAKVSRDLAFADVYFTVLGGNGAQGLPGRQLNEGQTSPGRATTRRTGTVIRIRI